MEINSFEIAMLIKEIYSNTMGILSENLRNKDLTHQQIMIMKIIGHNRGKVNLKKICDEMHLAKGTVSGIVTRLEAMGYIKKVKDDNDKRNTYIVFSEKGIEFQENFRNQVNLSFDKVFENFTDDEKREVRESLIKLRNKIRETK